MPKVRSHRAGKGSSRNCGTTVQTGAKEMRGPHGQEKDSQKGRKVVIRAKKQKMCKGTK